MLLTSRNRPKQYHARIVIENKSAMPRIALSLVNLSTSQKQANVNFVHLNSRSFGELIYNCKIIQPFFFQVQSTRTFFQRQT